MPSPRPSPTAWPRPWPCELTRRHRPAPHWRPANSCSRRSATGSSPAKPLRDVIAPGLDVLFCGINPGVMSFERGHHFARPGNRFWPALHGSGFTPRLMSPDEDAELLRYGLGITNLVDRPTKAADELTNEELRAGAEALTHLAARYEPSVVAVVGVTAYRAAFARPKATIGEQPEKIAASTAWVLPNPSGLNAHYQLPDLVRLFGELRAWV